MNSIKIEKGAILALKKVIYLHGKMNELLNEDDKEPSWDGDILVYSNEDLKAENIIYKIPTQVKGKNDENLLKRSMITYPVEYKNLRNYFNNGGVCYFVIIISDDGERVAIFYNALTPIKLQSLLKGTEEKKPDQTKNIPFCKLKNNKDELFTILLQFGHDSKEQGAKELVRKSISLKDMKKIDSIKATAFVLDGEDLFQKMVSGEVCCFGHLEDADIWIPIEYDSQIKMKVISSIKKNEPLKVDGKIYYDSFEMRKSVDNTFSIKLSENLIIDIEKHKFVFKPLTELEQIIKDIQFLEAIQYGKTLYVGEHKLCEYNGINFNNEFKRMIKYYKQLQLAIKKFEVRLGKRFADFNDDDWRALDVLLNIYQKKIQPKEESAWYYWRWEGKIVPFFIANAPDGETYIENAIHFRDLELGLDGKEKRYLVPSYMMLKRDVWASLYDVDEKTLLEELNFAEFCKETENDFSLLLIEILAAYDQTKYEKYFVIAKAIADKLLDMNPEYDYWKINKLQLAKRKRDLFEEELEALEYMEKHSDDKKVVCAVNILLENRRKAKKELSEMSEEDKKLFMTFPIYNLL